MKTKLLITILIMLCTLPSWSVEIFSRKLNSQSGLPDDNVRFLLQDSRGFVWMGTPGGLYRYDGYFFTTYKHTDDGNTRLLNNNHINGLYDAGDDRLLVSQQGGQLSVYDTRRSLFVDVSEAEKQQLYANCRKVKADDRLTAPHRQTIERGGAVINDNLGNPVVIDNTGMLWHIDRRTGQTVKLRVFDEQLFPLVSSKKYKVVVSEQEGLIWVSTNGSGITVYDRHTRTEQHIRQQSGLISTDYIVDMCLDRDGNVWVADEFHGVDYLTTARNVADVRLLAPQVRSLRSNQVYIMRWLADSTMVVANTLGDVYKTDKTLNIPAKPDYQGVDIHAVCSDRQGLTWIGTRQQGLMVGDRSWYRHEPGNTASLSANNVYYLLCDREGRVWIACEDSYLDLAVPQTDGTYKFRHFFDSHFSARVMYQDTDGIIWVGTKNGLYSFRPDQLLKDTAAYEHPLTGADLNYSDVSCIYEDSRGLLWVGTIGSGVYSIDNHPDQGRGRFSRHTTLGLISNDVQAIIEDGDGVMWIATKNGLTTFNPKGRKIGQYYQQGTLMRNYYADNCACRLPDGRLAFGTNAGIVVYTPENHLPQAASLSPQALSLDITEILVNGIQREYGEELQLAYDENSLTIRFSAFNYRDVAGIRYSYWLEGYDRQWSEPTAYSFVDYRHLPPGRYVLHLRTYGPGQSSDAERTLTIAISRPWWRTWWAYLIYLLLATAIGYAVYRQLRTIYNLRRRISIEQQLTEYKLQFFTNISHEFRTPLTIIRGAMDRMRSVKELPAELRQPVSSMQRGTDRMLRLVNQLLEFRKMQNNKLRLALEKTDVVAFVKEICQNFNDVAENKRISYNFLPNVKTAQVYIDRQHVDKMVYNLLSNAFKYTPMHGSVMVRLKIGNAESTANPSIAQSLTLSISDTGVGIPREKQPELFQRFVQSTFSNNSIGIGLHLTKALVDVHHGTISFEENKPQGSVFTICLPTDRSVYCPEDFLQESKLESTAVSVSQPQYRELMPEPMNDRHVLVVEDDSDVADFLRQTLQPYFNVSVAMDGGEALKCIGDAQPDLVVSDVMMPIMDGYELTRRIRTDAATQALPIVLLTALTADDKRLRGLDCGADAYLTKPFDAQLLIATCRQLLQQRDKLRQSYAAEPAGRTAAALPEIIVDERDRQLLSAMNHWLYSHLSNAQVSVDDLAEAMGYRRSVFFKKVKTLTGQTPADYIRTLRMNRAAELLRDETLTVAEVTYQVGISDPHYFAKVFRQQFGVSPKQYQKGQATKDVCNKIEE